MDFFIDENMIKTIKPFGIAAIGLAAVASNLILNQLFHTCLTDTRTIMTKRKCDRNMLYRRKDLQAYIIKETHALLIQCYR